MKISLLGKQLKKKISPKIFLEFFFFPNFLKLCNLMIYCCLMDMDMDMNMNKNVNIIMNMNMIICRSKITLNLGLSIIRDLVVQINFLTHRIKTPNIGWQIRLTIFQAQCPPLLTDHFLFVSNRGGQN